MLVLPTELTTALLRSLCNGKDVFKVASKVGTHHSICPLGGHSVGSQES